MMVYLLKVSFVIGIAYLFYKAVLQQESFFSANRLYLLGCVALAFALPFVTLPQLINQQGYLSQLLQPESITEPGITTPVFTETPPVAEVKVQPNVPVPPQFSQEEMGEQAPAQLNESGIGQHSWLFWLTLLYLFGAGIFSLSLLFQVGSIIYKIITTTDKIEDGDVVIVNTTTTQAPCSFFRYIFIHPDDYDFETYEQIIAHEKIHARMGHTFDLLLAEIAVIILWFNPLVWLFKKEMEKNNEYQTDATMLGEEQVSKRQYQLNLLQIAVPHKPLAITTNYNQSLLKQRIMMMNAKRSTPHAYWKYTFLAPLFFGAILVMNEPATSMGLPETNTLTPALRDAFASINTSTNEETANLQEESAATDQEGKKSRKEQVKTDAKEAAKPEKDKVKSDLKADRKADQKAGKQKDKSGKKRGFSMNVNGPQTDMSEGYWYSHEEDGKYCIDFKGSRTTSSWNMSRCFDKGQFQNKGNDVFVMTREAGTLQLTGNLAADVSQGKYKFTEDASFKKYLADNKITSDNRNFQFHLFFSDVDKKYIDYLKKQYGTVKGEELLAVAVHGVTLQDFQKYMALFKQYDNKKPSMEEVVAARIHGIDESYVKEIEAMGYKNLSLEEMMEARIHGVDRSYVESLSKAGFANLPLEKVMEAKIHGVDPATVKEMQALGFGKLSLDKVIELKIHGVNAAYLKDLQAAGYKDVTIDQAVAAKIHGLNSASIKEIRSLGFKDLSMDDMMSLKIHGVNAAYIEDLKKAGFSNLSADDAVAAKIHGINSDFIAKARKNGYNLNSIDKYISLKIHGMAMESLKEKK
ncbi:M56 family metallopeptidase [Pontibacter ruber]|uniref:M56 family metallopeptidase n=1 Tax=Pontibacter ruber TaxID=1343895 RepID=A0ABW5CZZ3_9BACT|nr:M56 family metallopeptidase [Pontibacter ruber]